MSARLAIIDSIHRSGHRLVVNVTGGGRNAIGQLLHGPSSSASVLEAVCPDAEPPVSHRLGGPVDESGSEPAARALAMAAWQRGAELLADPGDRGMLRGIGATAGLATDLAAHGDHRVHVAWQSAARTVVTSYDVTQRGSRSAEFEAVMTRAILAAAADACGVEGDPWQLPNAHPATRRVAEAPLTWTELLTGDRDQVTNAAGVHGAANPSERRILFPGAFNPPHVGHSRMAELAAARIGCPVTWELSIANVDKPPLDFVEIETRLASLAGRNVLLTRAPTFVEKAQLAPGCTFVVGADTIERIAALRYYGGIPAQRDASIRAIAEQGCRFLVFGRMVDGRFRELGSVALPNALRAICDGVPAEEFRDDTSSTQLRACRD